MIHHGDTECTEESDGVLSGQIVGAAVEVHRRLGPGLLESSYQRCLAHELTLRGLRWEQQREVPLCYKGVVLRSSYRIDFLAEQRVVVEVKSIELVQPIHRAQLLTYLKILDLRVRLLINFNVETLFRGVRRMVNGYS
ncbi:MAG: GxxExxY protein [Gemmatimonadales bacterium]|nr:GxxExxY protein [Gemmatimonadales bacterium]